MRRTSVIALGIVSAFFALLIAFGAFVASKSNVLQRDFQGDFWMELYRTGKHVFEQETRTDVATSYLTREKISALEFGLYKMEQGLKSSLNDSDLIVTVGYQSDQNRINVFVLNTSSIKATSRDGAINACRERMQQVRKFFGIDPNTGTFLIPGVMKNSLASFYFSSNGFRKNAPTSFGSDVDGIIHIRATASYRASNDSKLVQCEAPLLGMDVLITE